MFFHLFKFELRYWLRQPMVYIFFLINALLVFGATSSDEITIGGGVGNVFKNAPYVVENYYGFFSLLSLLMITAFLNSAAARDFTERTSQIIFTTPIRKRDFLLGRFAGSLLIAIIPFLGVSAGVLIGSLMPWIEPERIGPTIWSGHWHGLMVFILPNMLFAGSIIFCIAALTRSTMLSFIGSIGLLVGYLVSLNLVGDIENEVLGALLDPFGIRTFSVATKYWTVAEQNSKSMGLEGLLLLNRIIWIAVGVSVFAFTWYRFSFDEKSRSGKQKQEPLSDPIVHSEKSMRVFTPDLSTAWSFRQLISQIRIEIISIMKNIAFIIIVGLGSINVITSMSLATSQGYGLTALPVTYNLVDIIQGTLYLFIIAFITFYSGMIVWKEREAKVNDIYDALPFPDWIPVISKTIALFVVVLSLLLMGIGIGVITQLIYGFTDIRPEVYVIQLLVSDGLLFLMLIILSIVIHALANNRYLGYFLFIIVLIINAFIWQALDVESNLVKFNGSPSLIYSDINQFGPFLEGKIAFRLYWQLAGLIMLAVGLAYWVRGREAGFGMRSRMALKKLLSYRPALITIGLLWFVYGCWLFYDTQVRNSYKTSDEMEQAQVNYEKLYKKYEFQSLPRTISLDYRIELYPEKRWLELECKQWIQNKDAKPINIIYFTLPASWKSTIQLPGSSVQLMDTVNKFAIYKLEKAILPGDSVLIRMSMQYHPSGIENEVSNTSVVDNGTFFNNMGILPQIGYQPSMELADKNKRKKYGLPMRRRMPRLSDDSLSRMNTYLNNNSDWVRVHSVFGTSEDQTAIAPGSLRRQWKENGRNYFEYELDHPSMNFYSFLSGRYQVRKKDYKGISLEVYYDQRHDYNVDKMLTSMERSIDYYSKNFGPYRHKQARIIEFPRYASFAQAFPGTMPYSESIGFIANLEDPEDIDMVTYVVAHEMAHQWWAHQVVGPEMQGSTVLSESLSQYSALLVMEKMYGKEQMHKFLRYEMDGYLRSRGSEADKELPLQEVEDQGYIHYKKASVVMFHLRELLGVEKVNLVLKDLVATFGHRGPPYPNSRELVSRLKAQAPDSLRNVIDDLFQRITLFDNRTLEASTKKVKDGFETTIKIQSAKVYADSTGRETTAVLDDWIEVGLFTKPEEGKKTGRPIELKRIKVREKERTITFFTKEKPWQAGVDPNHYLIDRIPDDNLKKVMN